MLYQISAPNLAMNPGSTVYGVTPGSPPTVTFNNLGTGIPFVGYTPKNGDVVTISGATGSGYINGSWQIQNVSVLSSTWSCTLTGCSGTTNYLGGGTVIDLSQPVSVWLPFASIYAGSRPINLRSVRLGSFGSNTNPYYAVVVKYRGQPGASGSASNKPVCVDATPASSFTYITSNGLVVPGSGSQKYGLYIATNIGATEVVETLDASALSMLPNEDGCITIYGSGPTLNQPFALSFFVEEL